MADLSAFERYRDKLRELLPELRERYGACHLDIFGSYRRGEQSPDSDLDVLVEFDGTNPIGRITYGIIEDSLSDALGVKVDLVRNRGPKLNIGKRILEEVVPV